MIPITNVYVGAIYEEGSEGETIYRGNYRSGTDSQGKPVYTTRATVEHVLAAIPSLVEMCEAIVEGLSLQGRKATFRILHFSKDGIEEVSKEMFVGMSWYGHKPMTSF